MCIRDRADGVGLQVLDSGAPVPEKLAERLFQEPVASAQGLGIGLYHAARLASGLGYQLRLAENRPGAVCFQLTPR